VQKILGKMDLATEKDIAGLENRIKRLEQKETTENKEGMSE